MRRVSIVGSPGSGKTTIGRRLAARLDVPFIELDALFHPPGWKPLPHDRFRAQVSELLAPDGWVVDGNYSAVQDGRPRRPSLTIRRSRSGDTERVEVRLDGGVANAGSVVRVGAHVLRPSTTHTRSIHRFLAFVGESGFEGASRPVGVDPDGRERLVFIEGDVPLVPYPGWAQSDRALGSIARLMRRFHQAAREFEVLPDDTWNREMADPVGGSIVCHNDVCLENVVFRDGEAVALVDFEFAAPGRAVYDVACFARMCVPIDDPSRVRFGWDPADLPRRLRLVADEYGLDSHERYEMVDALDESIRRGGEFLLRRVEAGDPNFTEMWNTNGGMLRFDRRREWWASTRPRFDTALR